MTPDETRVLNELRLQIEDCGGSLLADVPASLKSLQLCSPNRCDNANGEDGMTASAVVYPIGDTLVDDGSAAATSVSGIQILFSFPSGFRVGGNEGRATTGTPPERFETLNALLLKRPGGAQAFSEALRVRVVAGTPSDSDSDDCSSRW